MLLGYLFVNADPGTILTGAQREFCRGWPSQEEITVKGTHFIQEDSPREIGEAVGLTSTSSVSYQLSTLQNKGYLRRDAGRPRTVEVRLPGHPAVRPHVIVTGHPRQHRAAVLHVEDVAEPVGVGLVRAEEAEVTRGAVAREHVPHELPELSGRAVQLGGEATADAPRPVGDLH